MMGSATYQEFLARIVEQFVGDAETCIENVKKAAASGDVESLREAAHGLKGVSGNTVGACGQGHRRDVSSTLV